MLRRCLVGLGVSVVASCGGGGGGVGNVTPAVTTSRLIVAPIEIGATTSTGELLIGLEAATDAPPVLLQVAIELPTALTLPANDRLVAVAPLTNLDGDFVDGRFVVLCGDAANRSAPSLSNGGLFRLRVQPSQPRQPGTYTVHLRNLRAATGAGEVAPADTGTVAVDVIVK